MKRLVGRTVLTLAAIVLLLASASSLFAEVKQISYQGRVTTAAGSPVADGNHTFRFDLYGYPTTGMSLWNETASIATKDGFFSYPLGSATPLNDNTLGFDSLYLQVTFDGQVQTPRTPLIPAPRAHRVNSIHGARGGTVLGSLFMYDTLAHRMYADFQPYSGTDDAEFALNGFSRYVWLDMGSPYTKSVRLPTDAVDATEMQNEPGVGSYVFEPGFDVTSGVTYLAGRTMFAPSDGYVLVFATGTFVISHVAGQADAFYVGVSDNTDSLRYKLKEILRIPDALPTGSYNYPVTVHGLFPVDSGSQAYYFLAQPISGDCHVSKIALSELFVPTAYTTVTVPMPRAGEDEVQTVALDPAAERSEAAAANQQRIDKELAAMKAELEALKQQLNAQTEADPTHQ